MSGAPITIVHGLTETDGDSHIYGVFKAPDNVVRPLVKRWLATSQPRVDLRTYMYEQHGIYSHPVINIDLDDCY
jgi:hypothetical protein